MTPANTLESIARELFEALDRLEFDRIVGLATDDVQAVDEITRGWLRGRPAMEAYFASMVGQVSDIHSTLSDLRAVDLGDIGIATMVLDQDYDLGGQRISIHAPTSIVTRRVDGEWRVALLHTVPLADEG